MPQCKLSNLLLQFVQCAVPVYSLKSAYGDLKEFFISSIPIFKDSVISSTRSSCTIIRRQVLWYQYSKHVSPRKSVIMTQIM